MQAEKIKMEKEESMEKAKSTMDLSSIMNEIWDESTQHGDTSHLFNEPLQKVDESNISSDDSSESNLSCDETLMKTLRLFEENAFHTSSVSTRRRGSMPELVVKNPCKTYFQDNNNNL